LDERIVPAVLDASISDKAQKLKISKSVGNRCKTKPTVVNRYTAMPYYTANRNISRSFKC